ncbi:MAG: (2Fe-2S)-binding protein [Planctomycetes bacterium]|nr:(2Fe-2S)-binding protein [Planctomycetota bacterium]
MAELVEVTFLPDDRTAWVSPGTNLVDAGAAAGVEVVTGCTRGMCGTDPVVVREGADGLAPPTDDERATLDRMGLGPEYRLACSAAVRAGRVVVELGSF